MNCWIFCQGYWPWLSQYRYVGLYSIPSSDSNCWNQTASFATSAAATSSASQVDSATNDLRRLAHETGPPRWRKTKPDVERKVWRSPAWSESQNLLSASPSIPNCRPKLIVFRRYAKILFTACQCCRPGFYAYLATCPTENEISGRVITMTCINDPTAALYGVACISFSSSSFCGDISGESRQQGSDGMASVLQFPMLNFSIIFWM